MESNGAVIYGLESVGTLRSLGSNCNWNRDLEGDKQNACSQPFFVITILKLLLLVYKLKRQFDN